MGQVGLVTYKATADFDDFRPYQPYGVAGPKRRPADESPPEVAAVDHDRMIIKLKPECLDAWLPPQRQSQDELQKILSYRQTPYYEHEVMAA
jgi:hypothetical protein